MIKCKTLSIFLELFVFYFSSSYELKVLFTSSQFLYKNQFLNNIY